MNYRRLVEGMSEADRKKVEVMLKERNKTVKVKSHKRKTDGNYNEWTFKPKVYSDDRILQDNPRPDRFPKCQYVTSALIDKLNIVEMNRNNKRVFGYAPREMWGNLMLYGEKLRKENPKKKILPMPPTEEGLIVWFVKNETGGYTAMLPEDW